MTHTVSTKHDRGMKQRYDYITHHRLPDMVGLRPQWHQEAMSGAAM